MSPRIARGLSETETARPLNRWMRAVLYASSMVFIVNGVQLLSGQTATYFAWTAQPLSAATLGAAYFGLAAGQFIAARQRTWAAARLAVPWLWVLLGLFLGLTIVHWGEFHFASPPAIPRFAAWFWVISYAGIALASVLATGLQLRMPGGDPPRQTPLPKALRIAFILQVLLIGVPGTILLLLPKVFFPGWLYTPSELTIQATGTGFIAIGVLALHAFRENDLTRIKPLGALFTVFSVLELIVLALNVGVIDWRSPTAWTFVVLILTLVDPGTHALFGRKVLRLRKAKHEAPARGTPGDATADRPGPPGPALDKAYGATRFGEPMGKPDSAADARQGGRPRPIAERPWFRLWPQDVPKSLDYPEISVPELMHRAAQLYPNRAAYRFFGAPMTYWECADAVDRFAAGLRKIGVRPGDRVSVMLLSTPHAAIVLGGVLEAGGILVQTSPLYTPQEIERLYNDAGVETVVTLDLFWPKVAKVKPKTKVARVVVCDMADFLTTPVRQLYGLQKRRNLKKAGNWPLRIADEPWVYRFADLAATPPEREKAVVVKPDDVAVLQYTGGTTGIPKGAMLTHRNLVAGAFQGGVWFGNGKGPDRIVSSGVPFHVSGLIGGLQFLIRGDENILVPDPRAFGTILKELQKRKATILAGPPTMYVAMLRDPKYRKYDVRSLRASIATSAPLPHEVRVEFERWAGCRLLSAYGLTEACPAISNSLEGLERDGAGIPQSDTDAAIIDADDSGKMMATGEVGELAIRGPQVMKGYWNLPEETARVFHDDWLLTGDLATMGEDGYFTIVDRKKDMINASGYKVYPVEVEDVLFAHPAVSEAAVIGVPDAYRGETVKAFIVRKPGVAVTEQEIVAFCKERLAPYKVPKIFEFVSDLPKTVVGKVLHRELREREQEKPSSPV